jgi:hypothetical protein
VLLFFPQIVLDPFTLQMGWQRAASTLTAFVVILAIAGARCRRRIVSVAFRFLRRLLDTGLLSE